VDYIFLTWDFYVMHKENVTPQRVAEEIAKIDVSSTSEDGVDQPTADDVVIDFCVMHFGKGNENPMQNVKFYSKRQPNGETSPVPPG
jgi:hypothetical protein